MKSIKNILVPIDFSDNSKAAFEFAIGLAEDLDAKVKVVHVLGEYNSPSPLIDNLIIPAPDESEVHRLDAFLQEEQDTMGNVLSKRKVKVNQETLFGSIVPTILNLSNSGEYDLIVMGVTGEKAVSEVFFGSTASEISQKSKCPVLLVPRNYRYAGIMDILFACDFEHTSIAQMKSVASVAEFFDANVNLVFVKTEDDSDKGYDSKIKEIKQTFSEYAPDIEFKAEIISQDSVVEGVNEYCKENNVDMVLVVTKNRNFWQRFLHASVTKQLAIYAEEPVFIIHED